MEEQMGQATAEGVRESRGRDVLRGALIGGLLGVLGGIAIGGVVGWWVQIFTRWRDDGTPPWVSVAEAFDEASTGNTGEAGAGR
jgi:hypothetical protein